MKHTAGPRLAAALLASALLAGGCGDSSSEDSARRDDTSGSSAIPSDGGASGDSRDAFEAVVHADDRFQAELNALLRPVMEAAQVGDRAAAEAAAERMTTGMSALVEAELPALLAAYDSLARSTPEVAADALLVRGFTEQVAASLRGARTFEEMSAAFARAEADGAAAGAAVLRLDEVSQADCGLVLAD